MQIRRPQLFCRFWHSTKASNFGALAFAAAQLPVGSIHMPLAMVQSFGRLSFSLGYQTQATGKYTMASGWLTNAKADFSNAFGYNTVTNGKLVNWHGYYTIAKLTHLSYRQYNDTTGTSTSVWIATDPVFVIGNGTSVTARSNCFTILKNGYVGILDPSPLQLLQLAMAISSR